MPESRGALSLRVVTGVVGTVVAVATITAAALLPLPTLTRAPSALEVVPVPSAQQLVCPGSLLRLGDESGENATSLTALGRPSVTTTAINEEVVATPLATPDTADDTGAPSLLTSANTEVADAIAGAQHQTVDRGDYRGTAAAECARPSSDTWLVGGSTATGRTTLLSIANPGAVMATITLEVFSENGVVEAPGTKGIVVAAGSQRVLSLAGLAPSLSSIAVHVTSRGGPVVASLQESIVRGIESSGVDLVGTTAAPTTENVIPGVVILNAEATAGRLGEDGFGDLATVLRAYVPGAVAANATVRVLPEDPAVAGASFDLTLAAGVVSDIPVESLADGSYTVVVTTDQPVVTAIRASTVSADADDEGASDLAWFSSSASLADGAIAAVASGFGSVLHLYNPSSSPVTVTYGSHSISVPAGGATATFVDAGRSYVLSGAAGLHASISYAGPGALAGYLLGASATTEAPVTIYP